jgi:hypothetical protein
VGNSITLNARAKASLRIKVASYSGLKPSSIPAKTRGFLRRLKVLIECVLSN